MTINDRIIHFCVECQSALVVEDPHVRTLLPPICENCRELTDKTLKGVFSYEVHFNCQSE